MNSEKRTPRVHYRVCLIPLDARPVCYDLPRRLAAMAGIDLCMPAPKLLGNLKEPADPKTMQRWIKNNLVENNPIILALDTIVYGGLIPSRVGKETLETLQKKMESFFLQVKAPLIYAFSSILRMPNYNNAEEEPDYWQEYGTVLYEYSSKRHQLGPAHPDLLPFTQQVPTPVLKDFLNRRERNFLMNQGYLALVQDGVLDYLTYCQDDTGPWGLNVQEAEQLRHAIAQKKLAQRVHVQTGADEVASCMLARWFHLQITQQQPQQLPLRVAVIYSHPPAKSLVLKFDGIALETLITQQILACGAVQVTSLAEADLVLAVHTPQTRQGDHCEGSRADTDGRQAQAFIQTLGELLEENRRVMLADVAYANGADPALMNRLVQTLNDLSRLYGYAAWNTGGNTIGSALAMGILRLLAERQNQFNADAWRRLLFIRLADDWYYQADVRARLKARKVAEEQEARPQETGLQETGLNVEMASGLELLQSLLGLEDLSLQCRYPCRRLFEVEIQGV